MTRIEILEQLAAIVAEHVMNNYPLNHLVGDDGYGPDRIATAELQQWLKNSGIPICEQAADKIGVTRLMEDINTKPD